MGAPIVNNGYYDIPINPPQRNNTVNINEYDFNKKINLTVNNNKQSYLYNQIPVAPSNSLYYETDRSQSGYYQDPMFLAYDAGVPLVKKKEQICNALNTIESFDGSYSLNTQFIPNVNRNYWDQQAGTTYMPFVEAPKQYVNVPSTQPNQYINVPNTQHNQYINVPNTQPKQYVNIPNETPIVKGKKKLKRKRKTKYDKIDSKTLWNIILILFLIILILLFKIAFDNKIIVLNNK